MNMSDNELIAEFMGLKLVESEKGGYKVQVEDGRSYWPDFQYHTSWDWLMPVVEKITDNEIVEVKFSTSPNRCLISYFKYPNEWTGRIYVHKDHLIHEGNKNATLLDCTYRAVVTFIKWYNENKKP